MILADKIMTLRKSRGWSQEELAEKLDISRQSVSKWENGTSIPEIDKILALSELFGVSTDYLLKDELEQEPVQGELSESKDSEQKKRRVSMEEANQFIELRTRLAWRIAAAISLLVLTPIPIAIAEGKVSGMNSELAEGLGGAALFLMAAVGVAVLILCGLKLSRYEYLQKECFCLEYGVAGLAERKKEEFAPAFRISIAIGVSLCILGVVPSLLAEAFGKAETLESCLAALFFIMIAAAVFAFVRAGMIDDSYNQLLQQNEYTPEHKEFKKKAAPLAGVYWCLVTAIFLWRMFMEGGPRILLAKRRELVFIWPVAGVLFAALWLFLKWLYQFRRKREKK